MKKIVMMMVILAAAAPAQNLDGLFQGKDVTAGGSYSSSQVLAAPGDEIEVQWAVPNGSSCSGSWTTFVLPCSGSAEFPAPPVSTQISITATAGTATSTQTLQITIAGSAQQPTFSFAGLGNAFSFENGPLAPQTIMSLFGLNLAAGQTIAAPNQYPLLLGGTQLAINGTYVPLSFVSSTQINFLCPALIPGAPAIMVVYNNGVASAPVPVPVHDYLPGLASQNGSVITLDASTFVVRGPGNPFTAGNPLYVALYGSGFGAPINGKLPGLLSVMVDNQVAGIQFAGPAPGLVDMAQINIEVDSLSAGTHPAVVFYEGRRVGAFNIYTQ